MRILAIDPGPRESGFVIWDDENGLYPVVLSGHTENAKVREMISANGIGTVAIERIRGYGIVAGDDTFDTCEWIGRFDDTAQNSGISSTLIGRKDIKRHLCGNTSANDKYVRAALIDRVETADFIRYDKKGTKKPLKGGRLYGLSGHAWSALAVAIYVVDNTPRER